MFEKRLKEIEARKLEIRQLLESDNKDLNLEELEKELRSLEAEKQELEKRKAIAEGIQSGTVQTRTITTTANEPETRTEDKFASLEYRRAFMDYVTRGVKSDILEFRADATTGVADIGAVIPTTILDRIQRAGWSPNPCF